MRKINSVFFVILLVMSLFVYSCSRSEDKSYDIVIRGGKIYDGSGGESYVADIGIKDGKILAIGKLKPNADAVIDAKDLYVSPGFIDMHNHAFFKVDDEIVAFIGGEIDMDELRIVKNYLFQGVTTVVSGNCGAGDWRIKELFEDIRQNGMGLNLVQLVGHGTIRQEVMGMADRAPSAEELEKMKAMVQEAMEGGAFGLSTGLYYPPGCYATTEEVIELALVVNKYGGFYATHVRDEGVNMMGGIEESMSEAIRIAEEADVPVQIAHLKASGTLGQGKAKAVTKIFEEARAKGVKLFADQYPYNAGSTTLAPIVLDRWIMADGKALERFMDPALKEKIRASIKERIERYMGPESIHIANFKEKPEWEGKNLKEICEILKVSPTEAAIELLRIGNPSVIVFMMDPKEVEYFMKKPYVMISSDGLNVPFDLGVPHPRNYGAFTKKIRDYVLDKKVITMEQAIKAATSLPADMLELDDRGLIKEGYVADILVFNPETVRDKATYQNPHQYSDGIAYLLINGILAIDKGKYTGVLAGKPIEHKKR
ncbi:MAG: D-aminoacylase [Candidatus Aminicenantes bacterium]|nr:MAG: D-aminoacylase [Candidatus Aminicenantes bacterium]